MTLWERVAVKHQGLSMDMAGKEFRKIDVKRVANTWLSEGRNLLFAAKVNREHLLKQKLDLVTAMEQPSNHGDKCDALSLARGLALTSMLALGYSIEMFLKGDWQKYTVRMLAEQIG